MATEGSASGQPATSPAGEGAADRAAASDGGKTPASRRARRRDQLRQFGRAIRDSDVDAIETALLRLSQSRRWLAPLALAVGALVMLFTGLKLLVTNWRLLLIQLLPATWVWAAMLDLKAHLLRERSFHVLTGPILIPLVLAVAAITAASFYLNAVFAYSIAKPAEPDTQEGFRMARSHRTVILGWGAGVGVLLGLSTLVVTRWGELWFGLSLSIVLAVMMVCYVAVPARLIGIKTTSHQSRREKLTASAVSGAIGAVVTAPPYVLGRLGLLMLGWRGLFIPGIIVLSIGLIGQACATSAVKAVKMSAKLLSGRPAS